jgi:hypothetical protein
LKQSGLLTRKVRADILELQNARRLIAEYYPVNNVLGLVEGDAASGAHELRQGPERRQTN